MSCPHGNPIGGCDTCDEVDAAFEAGKRSALAEQPAPMIRGDIRDGLVDDEPAQQEPVAVPTTSYEHRKFVLVGRDWYERFAAFHDDCQIGEQLTWQEKTIRQQGYENGWNDAQRYLKEPQSTSPTPAQPSKPLTLGQKQRLWSSVGDKPTLKDRVNAYGTAIEAAHGIKGDA